MPGTVSPYLALQWFTNAGAPAVGYHLHTYSAGTSSPITTYTDVDLTTPNTNPIVLDSAGRATIFLTAGQSYKYVMALPTDTTPPLSPIWTRDNISAVPPIGTTTDVDVTATAGESISAGDAVYLSDGSGGTTAGRWYKTDADQVYSSSTAQVVGFSPSAISTSAVGSVRTNGRVTGLSGLTPGTLYYASATAGALTATPPTNARAMAVADSSTTVIIVDSLPDATATTAGQIGVGTQTIPGAKTAAGVWTFTPAAIFTAGATFSALPLGVFGYSRLASDATKNANTTLANLTAMSFSVVASGEYWFRFVMKAISTGAAGLKFAITGPAAPTGVIYGVQSFASFVDPASAVAFATSISCGTAGIEEAVTVEGYLRNGVNAGTVQLQFAQQVSDVSNSVVRAESFVIYMRRA